eukprot:TRINITY_DN6707_c0_g1_i1.p1 TRINITY_DN6707_c0_g1~~TRINITY_DN6707_c0_g1_i1.p1  ORF type:complete len:432 (+),score=101.63 TRINITY_DN6707_c0_g1_i1:57-1298(+)
MQQLRDVVIVSACRTAIGSFGGSLKSVRSHDLAATVMKGAIQRAGIDPTIIGDIRMGCCFPDIDAMNVARVAALIAGLPQTTPACTINRVCASGMEAVQSGAMMVALGHHEAVLAGGVESMSYQPYILPTVRWGQRLQDGPCLDRMINNLHAGSQFTPYPADGPVEKSRGKPYIMGMTAEFLAHKHNISREEQDELALRSNSNTERAVRDGIFRAEIVPVEIKQKKKKPPIIFENDEHFRPGCTLESLQELKPSFLPKVGTVTAGNASGINDGASALILMSRESAQKYGLRPLATITGMGAAGNPPELMGESPVGSIRNLMSKTGRKVEDYDRVELNEAFAAQYLACERQLGFDRSKVNVNGSGIGLGHPVGSTGCRVIVTLLHELQRSQTRLGLASVCGGGGVSLATEITLE